MMVQMLLLDKPDIALPDLKKVRPLVNLIPIISLTSFSIWTQSLPIKVVAVGA
jgi:hypothetical protein